MSDIRNIYLAGKVDRDDWRHDIVEGLRESSPQNGTGDHFRGSMYVSGIDKPWPVLINSMFGQYNYTGPYFINANDSGFTFHGDSSHGNGASRGGDDFTYDHDKAEEKYHNTPLVEMKPWIVERCQLAIKKSDLVFAWIDDITCYGTIAEIGYAKALDIPVWIATPKKYLDLWFVFQMADQFEFIYDQLRSPIHPKDVLHGMLDDYNRDHPRFDFNSPIEKAFWDEWGGENSFYELTPQHSIGKYFVDFAHIPTKTAIELDGFASHSSTEDIAKDRKRQRDIEKQGWHVIRFGGKEIHEDVKSCVKEVWNWINDKVSEAIYS